MYNVNIYIYCNTLFPNSTDFTHSPRMRTDIRETFLRLFSFELIISIPRLHINNGLFPSHVYYSCILSHFFLFELLDFFTIYEYRSGKPKLCYTVNYSSCTIFITHCKAERFAITMNAKLSLSLFSCFGIRRLWGICFDFTPNTEYRYYILHS